MGRKAIEIDAEEFRKLCELQCTQREICHFFAIDAKTLRRWAQRTYNKEYDEVYEDLRQGGFISLRRAQWQLAQHNTTMAIWLGKNWLGQRDNMDVSVSEAKGVALDELEKMVLDDAGSSNKPADT